MVLKVFQVFIMLTFKFFNPELQHKDTESATKSKLIDLLSK